MLPEAIRWTKRHGEGDELISGGVRGESCWSMHVARFSGQCCPIAILLFLGKLDPLTSNYSTLPSFLDLDVHTANVLWRHDSVLADTRVWSYRHNAFPML